ncbi:MAG: response regulator [Lentisphaeria bacterium]|nr:response regulator [Lentisphaeria bacterium]
MSDEGNDEKTSTALVLIVEDEESNRIVLRRLLELAGYSVETAEDGLEALALLNTSMPDLILLDVNMPGLDGFETCQRIKLDPRTQDIPVIFLSGRKTNEDTVRGFDVGGVDYVGKPFHPPELLARVRTHVQLRKLRQIVPMCGYCNKIRSEGGDWEKISTYIRKETGSDISHGICPDCFAKLKLQYSPSKQ